MGKTVTEINKLAEEHLVIRMVDGELGVYRARGPEASEKLVWLDAGEESKLALQSLQLAAIMLFDGPEA